MLLRLLRLKGALVAPASRAPSARTFFVKCCLLAAALLPDTHQARRRPLSLIWDLQTDATAPPRGRGAENRGRRRPSGRPLPGLRSRAVRSSLRSGFAVRSPSQLQPLVSGPEAGLPGFGALGQTPVGPPARAGLAGREEEAERLGRRTRRGVPAVTFLSEGPGEGRGRVTGPPGSRPLRPARIPTTTPSCSASRSPGGNGRDAGWSGVQAPQGRTAFGPRS